MTLVDRHPDFNQEQLCSSFLSVTHSHQPVVPTSGPAHMNVATFIKGCQIHSLSRFQINLFLIGLLSRQCAINSSQQDPQFILVRKIPRSITWATPSSSPNNFVFPCTVQFKTPGCPPGRKMKSFVTSGVSLKMTFQIPCHLFPHLPGVSGWNHF